jgi:hypothetical protein
MIKLFEEFTDIDPYEEENWSDYRAFNDNDIEALKTHGFKIIGELSEQDDMYYEDDRFIRDIAYKYGNWQGKKAYIEISKIIFKPRFFDDIHTYYVMDICEKKPKTKTERQNIRIIAFDKKSIEECIYELYNYKEDREPIEL